ncbi:SDR family oxidoreductase [Candidatus Marinimicrobia bacterium PRS2]|nr:SDR family oxidoreductase [Candidatus Marinimicrobia bacterium PRS2]
MDNQLSIIFGGSGFIGQHLINKLGSNCLNLDIIQTENNYLFCDVRKPIDIKLGKTIKVIYNLAATHTTPGHEYYEYFETNIKGAENICDFARKKNINTIVFTSSIAPYGTWEEEKTEDSLPLPTSAYGSSKLVAEEIHKRWQAEKPDERKLIVVRPGVVFGQNEGGNFTRLYRAMKAGRFFYPGRKDTKKAAIYVKDLVRLMVEMTEKEKPGVSLYNTVYTPCYTLEEICISMAKVAAGKEPRFTIPSGLLKISASIINIFGKLIGKSFDGIHPDRVKKLMISTNINGQRLLNNGYTLDFKLEDAIYDWYKNCNKEELS